MLLISKKIIIDPDRVPVITKDFLSLTRPRKHAKAQIHIGFASTKSSEINQILGMRIPNA